MDDRQKLLQDWTGKLLAAFEIDGAEVDIDAVLGLAGKAAHGVVRPAAPLTTFVVGYAAGLAVGSGQAEEQVAMRSAMAVADALCAEAATDGGSE
ncbi:MAG: molybdopterin-guanine dinucleotide biosynthesis protein [Micrococcaceae bacterium]|jgi:hypothetical protein|uniref:DUF6457 domain-containing protein n=1 Tax=Arthrobacter TaxID=1663 RepID=UPI001C7DC23F|nr:MULTISPECIES: DUF6457 domain-containing protein [Arthrobacter]MCU1631476.1 molybdopterin-guanine dinucleotide biosynthesis protein [Micrococcaceae bacterium]MEC5200892.1 hypothetical protein [Arthrobacter sp. PL16]